MQIRIHSRNRLLWLCIGVLLVASILDDFAGWRVLLYGLLFAWLFGWIWVRGLAGGLRLEREMRFGWAQVGDRLEERFTLSNSALVPAVWVELRDGATLPDYPSAQVTGIAGNTRRSWRTISACTRRGVFSLGPLTLRSGDPLGLFTLEIHDPRTIELVVTPPVLPLPHIEVASGGRAGEGRPRPNAPERTVAVSGVRPHQIGDSLRWVHWPTTARRNELFVRTFDSTPSGDWWIVLDANREVQAGKGARSTLEHAIILAASLADRGLRLNRAVGLAALGSTLTWLPPQSSEGQRLAILRALARIEPGAQDLAFALSRLESRLAGAGSLILITSDATGAWLKPLLPLIWRGAVPTVLLLDPADFDPEGEHTSIRPLATDLARRGIARELIPPDLLDRPGTQPGRQGQWQWRVTPTGRAIAVNPPRDVAWRSFSPKGKG